MWAWMFVCLYVSALWYSGNLSTVYSVPCLSPIDSWERLQDNGYLQKDIISKRLVLNIFWGFAESSIIGVLVWRFGWKVGKSLAIQEIQSNEFIVGLDCCCLFFGFADNLRKKSRVLPAFFFYTVVPKHYTWSLPKWPLSDARLKVSLLRWKQAFFLLLGRKRLQRQSSNCTKACLMSRQPWNTKLFGIFLGSFSNAHLFILFSSFLTSRSSLFWDWYKLLFASQIIGSKRDSNFTFCATVFQFPIRLDNGP